MHSLLSYRFDRWIHEKSPHAQPGQSSPCKLLTVRLYVNDLALEKAFYTHLLGVAPSAEEKENVTLPLADGVVLVLEHASCHNHEKLLGLVELELETAELLPLWQSARAAALGRISELLEANGLQAFNAFSPSHFWLNLHQKPAE